LSEKSVWLSAPGLICCAGKNRDELYDSCLNGYQAGIKMAELPGAGKFPVGLISGELPVVTVQAELGTRIFEPMAYAGNTKIIRIIDAALEQIRPDIEKAIALYGPAKIGVCLGSCDNGSEGSLLAHQALFARGAFPDDYNLRFQSASFPAEFIARKFGLSGPVFACAAACASGASAIMRGAELIRAGLCDAVIAGGADIVSQTVFLGFHSLEAISDSLTNPFSKNRKGINLGEGAAFFLLDSAEAATGNSAVELLGAGESADACHMTAPDTDGTGAAKAMRAALLDAELDSGQIGYVNLHGTGTELNDKAEALAMKSVFYPQTAAVDNLPLPVSSTKPITGHTLGAAGALEAAICWMVLTEKRGLPVHCWDGIRDEEIPGYESCVFPTGSTNLKAPAVCMSNNFAFGGCNVSLILGAR
jgi:3-oxoacyl-[acyl-carrier-protein] synthase-1